LPISELHQVILQIIEKFNMYWSDPYHNSKEMGPLIEYLDKNHHSMEDIKRAIEYLET
jgi:hypothetical protein